MGSVSLGTILMSGKEGKEKESDEAFMEVFCILQMR